MNKLEIELETEIKYLIQSAHCRYCAKTSECMEDIRYHEEEMLRIAYTYLGECRKIWMKEQKLEDEEKNRPITGDELINAL